ncbi:ATP-binding cassette subfamily B protein RaxB [Caulobacter rhizosphaerae]|uniref:ATP-binding cassette subfamily B protein RaxB n=1 Tax=Caulobacter rhizosphaerae TaxID=2010972 RepID=A0ABU1N1B7_9CAUL|nr:peptidase domain-containing ABC transporter [Caulobacter rhizosphaerae]MDR6532205.1 ATP-binding cassette subfamily B protein RaxB [Caulobacter rhizosphaerae]
MTPDYTLQQTEAAECGLSCLAAIAQIFGDETDLPTLRKRFPLSSRGMSFRDITDIAGSMNLAARPLRCEPHDLPNVKCPAILHWGLSHFVVFVSLRRGVAKIFDPRRGHVRVSLKELDEKFTGAALEISPTPAFQRRRERSPLNLWSVVRLAPGLRSGLGQVVVLSLVLQAYVLISPFYMQFVVDDAVLKGDLDLLSGLAIGFGVFALFNVVADTLRGVATQKLSALMNWDMTQRLFHHLIRLPLPWFQRRRLADALMRFQALDPIKNLIAGGLIAAVLDGLLSIATAVMMFVFAPTLAAITVGCLALYLILRVASVPMTMTYAAKALTASIVENGKRIETLRAIQTIKVMAAEPERQADWSNRLADSIHAGQLSAFTNLGVGGVQKLIRAVVSVVVIYLAARAIMADRMSIGVLYAFMAYHTQFLDRGSSLIDQAVSWKLLDLYTFRLSDIVLTPVETDIDKPTGGLPEMRGKVTLETVGFSYAPHEPPVLKSISFSVEPGEFVAIVGPSGSGKSTLLKILCGLYAPTHGQVRIDDIPLSVWGPRGVRRNVGVVLQDDELLSGSIADNVAFFDETVDIERVHECLRLAGLEDDINRMPMRTETFVGDMGSSMSGGQKQRILLARALYRQPHILILDEATSHLDVARERLVNGSLAKLNITRLIVAHRPDTIAAADRVIVLQDGVVAADRRARRAEPNVSGEAGPPPVAAF